MAGVVAMVVAGLAPLRRVSQALAEIRDGRREQLAIEAPSEIAPLVVQLDELIAANRVTVERARSHVGSRHAGSPAAPCDRGSDQRRELQAEGQATRRRHGQKARRMKDNTLGRG